MTINVTSPPMAISLGRAGENEFRRHTIDWGAWLAESLAAWKNEVLEKIETLPTVTRAVVKRLLGIE